MSDFWKLRLCTLASTLLITRYFTGSWFTASGLSISLIAVNSLIMYYFLTDSDEPGAYENY